MQMFEWLPNFFSVRCAGGTWLNTLQPNRLRCLICGTVPNSDSHGERFPDRFEVGDLLYR
jgi:hypothetical protein